MIGQVDFIENKDKVQTAIERIKSFCPPEGYYLAFSGGKDSITIYNLAVEAGVKFDAHYQLTTIDPPEVVQFIRKEYPSVKIEHPEMSFWKLILKKGSLPLRTSRFCCEVLKERGGRGRSILLGIRWAESAKRKKRNMVTNCMSKGSINISPIIDFTDSEVWEYIKSRGLKYPSLYDEGFKRLGCIMCPMNPKNMEKELGRHPKYKTTLFRYLQKIIDAKSEKGKPIKYDTPEKFYRFWIDQNIKDENNDFIGGDMV